MRTFIQFLALLFLQFTFAEPTFGQGYILAVGGGSEQDGTSAWNYQPYRWAVDNAQNKRVAIIAFESESSSWLRKYFTETCGAKRAKHFEISSLESAQNPILYDSLITYDMLFFKGGDQAKYYTNYKNTSVHRAVNTIFGRGGVISGTSAGAAILSELIFSAEKGTIGSAESVAMPLDNRMVFQTDFLKLAPQLLFDTHFLERGRFARLLAFMANYFEKTGKTIIGCGIDDMTALAIDPQGAYQAWGTGAVNFYIPPTKPKFSATQTSFSADSVRVVQLISGAQFMLKNNSVLALGQQHAASAPYETGKFTLILSGSSHPSRSEKSISKLIESSTRNDKILIVTGLNTDLAQSYKTKLESKGATEVAIVQALSSNGTQASVRTAIEQASKFLFVNNEEMLPNNFMQTENGQFLRTRLSEYKAISAFLGNDAKFVGAQIAQKIDLADAAYNSKITWDKGLGLLGASLLMPASYNNEDLVENSMAAIPFGLQKFNLRFGIWLEENIDLCYTFAQEKSFFESFGTHSAIILENNAQQYAFSSTSSTGIGKARMAVGFDNAYFYALSPGKQIVAGTALHSNPVQGGILPQKAKIRFGYYYPKFEIYCENTNFRVNILTLSGKKIESWGNSFETKTISIENLAHGIYLLQVCSTDAEVLETIKFIRK